MTGSSPTISRKALDLLSRLFIAAVAVGIVWVVLQVLKALQDVLIPLGIAGILAYLLHPVVTLIEKTIPRRRWAVATLFVLIAGSLTLAGFYLGPPLCRETAHLVTAAPRLISQLWNQVYHFLTQNNGPLNNIGQAINNHLNSAVSQLAGGIGTVFHTFGLALGVVFVPFFLFYFLAEQPRIESSWRNYIPMRDSPLKKELIVIVEQTNKYLVAFFRGQIVVAATDGLLLAVGLTAARVNYGLAIGVAAMFLTIIPYFGIMVIAIAAILVSCYQPGGGVHLVLITVGILALVQVLENTVISPQVMGKRIGLHPMTIIISILGWSTVLGGLLGPILAIPLTATLKVLLTRYGLITPGQKQP